MFQFLLPFKEPQKMFFLMLDRKVSRTDSLTNFCLNNWANLLSRGRNYRTTPKWCISYLQTIASNVFRSVKLFFSFRVRPSFRFILFKLKQHWTSNDINLWKKEISTTIKVYEIVKILVILMFSFSFLRLYELLTKSLVVNI